MSALRPRFRKAGLKVPRGTKVSCSWPSEGGIGRKVRTDGETWFLKDGAEIFISPALGQDDVEVLATLTHEMIHAALGGRVDHRHAAFRNAAHAVGLTGKMCSTYAGHELAKDLAHIVKRLGPYPHVGVKV